jgi:hypothetical protein
MSKLHPIKNKLKYAARYERLWHTKVVPNKKKEQKKRGVEIEHITK